MVDSGNNMTEATVEIQQPDETVAVELEEGTEPQGADTDEYETVVEVEADQIEKAKSEGKPDYKAGMLNERAKKKAEREAREKAEREAKELREQVEAQGKLLAELRAGNKPAPDDYYGRPEEYVEAVKNWEKAKESVYKPQTNTGTEIDIDEEVLEAADASAELMRKALPDFDKIEESVVDALAKSGHKPEIALAKIADIAYGDDVDYGRVIVGLGKFPELMSKLLNAKSQGVLRKTLKEAAEKVKVHQRKKIETKPEPTVKASGGIHAGNAEVDRLRRKYTEDPTVANFQALQEAKAKLKGK